MTEMLVWMFNKQNIGPKEPEKMVRVVYTTTGLMLKFMSVINIALRINF